MVEFLETSQHQLKNKQVVELGAGTGMVGMAAAALGTTHTHTHCILGYQPGLANGGGRLRSEREGRNTARGGGGGSNPK